MKKAIILVFAAGLAGTLMAAPSEAAKGKNKGGGACAEDVQKFCKDVKPGEGRIAACLKEHEKELSKACSERKASAKERGKRGKGKGEMKGSFEGRQTSWRKGYKNGFKDGFRGCVAEGSGKSRMGQRGRAGRGNKSGVCAADAAKLCKDVKPGEGRVRDCLQENMKKLSGECKTRQERVKERIEERKGTGDSRKG